MLFSRRSSESSPSESVFVYGRNPTATSTLAVGLAVRRNGSFAWADCATSTGGVPERSHAALARGRSLRGVERGGSSGWAVPRWSAHAVEQILVPEDRMDSLRLLSYLALPNLLQELAAMSTAPSGESLVILTNLDALDRELRASVFGKLELHERLHEARVSLFVTASNRPFQEELSAFDRVLHIDESPGERWWAGMLVTEKGSNADHPSPTMPLRTAWRALGLDPTLLPEE